MNRARPNPRLQRTPSAPLSRQPLGDCRRASRLSTLGVCLLLLAVPSCAIQRTTVASQARTFGAVDPKAPELSPDLLGRVTKDLELGTIFEVLGPAHADHSMVQGGPCWEWRFTNGDILVIPMDTDPKKKPRSFSVWMIDYD